MLVAAAGIAAGCLALAATTHAATPVFAPPVPVNPAAATDAAADGAPRLATDGQGTWLVAWATSGGSLGSDADVVVARSTDLGASWSPPVAVDAGAASDDTFDFAPALATDGHGLWIVVWVATNGADTDLFVARSTDAGATWSARRPLHADAATDAGNDERPQIATDGAGTWIVVWDGPGRFGADRDVLAARSTDGGVTWTAPAAVAANAAGDRGADQRAQVAAGGAGTWLVVWTSNDTFGGTTGNDFDVMVARSRDGGATWSAPQPLNTNATTDLGLDDRPQLATDGGGRWIAVWVSDDTLGGTLGTDLDLLTARSSDGGMTWTPPAPLDANATVDAGADGGPAIATDGRGTWVVAWESNDPRGGTLGGSYDVVMAHSLDAGASWSAARALDPEAASDARRDVAPQLATDGAVWNAVWTGTGGVLGADGDVLRAGGRSRCGDGILDPGEECDDGNTRGGDVCPATCEYPPVATPGGSPGGATTPTAAPSSAPTFPDGVGTPTADGAATPTAAAPTPRPDPGTPTAHEPGAPTPSPSDPGVGSATPTAAATDPAAPSASGGGPASTPTVGPAASPTPVPTEPGVPSPVTTAFAGSLASRAAAKAAVGCQRAIAKAGSQLVATRLAHLGRCGRAVQRCVLLAPDDRGCLDEAASRCRRALAALTAADGKQAAAVARRCRGSLAEADVLAAAGLAYERLDCGGARPRSLDEVVACVVGEHACEGAALFEVLQPRAKELLRLPAMHAATLDAVVCLPDHGGDGAGVGDPAGRGKAVEACTNAVVRAGTSVVRKRLGRWGRCADALFACVQLAPGDGACLAKARARCDAARAGEAADARALAAAAAKRCREDTIPYATLRAAAAANLDALAATCAAVGVARLDGIADYRTCVLRAQACRLEAALATAVPRLPELLALVGRGFGDPHCPVR